MQKSDFSNDTVSESGEELSSGSGMTEFTEGLQESMTTTLIFVDVPYMTMQIYFLCTWEGEKRTIVNRFYMLIR